MNKNLIVELNGLSEGHMSIVERELKLIIEDYGWKKMIRECIQVKEEK